MRMILSKPMFAVLLICVLFEKYSEGSESSSSNNEDTASIPVIASGKRQHNIMRFGKRPAGGHNLIHFGKREGSKAPQHSFLSFGKRMGDQETLPDLIQYLQRVRDNSYKRGHTMMRFGKRSPSSHNFIRFGRGDGDDDYEDDFYGSDDGEMDAEKRGGHNMMYFGKRGGHSMLYFGKRAAGHKIMSFGKRDNSDDSLMPFAGNEDEGDDNLSQDDKRAHSMIHFGKREEGDDLNPEEMKRASHSMIHFGKREFDEEQLPYWNPTTYDKKQHNLLRFGKKMDGYRKGSHAMIHFGKRDDDKRAHSMIHFGKRSIDQNSDSVAKNQSANSPNQSLTRMKRGVEEPNENVEPSLVALIRYDNPDADEVSPEEALENAIKSPSNNYYFRENMNDLMYPEDMQPHLSLYSNYLPSHKKDASKNVFLRFG